MSGSGIASFMDFVRGNDWLTSVNADGISVLSPSAEAMLMEVFGVETAEELANALYRQGYYVLRSGDQVAVDFDEPRNIAYDENGDLIINPGGIQDWGETPDTPYIIGEPDDPDPTSYYEAEFEPPEEPDETVTEVLEEHVNPTETEETEEDSEEDSEEGGQDLQLQSPLC